jgi:hypothetical protein
LVSVFCCAAVGTHIVTSLVHGTWVMSIRLVSVYCCAAVGTHIVTSLVHGTWVMSIRLVSFDLSVRCHDAALQCRSLLDKFI